MSRLGREFLFVLALAAAALVAAFVIPAPDPVAEAAHRAATADGQPMTVYHSATGRAFATKTPSGSSYAARRAAGLTN